MRLSMHSLTGLRAAPTKAFRLRFPALPMTSLQIRSSVVVMPRNLHLLVTAVRSQANSPPPIFWILEGARHISLRSSLRSILTPVRPPATGTIPLLVKRKPLLSILLFLKAPAPPKESITSSTGISPRTKRATASHSSFCSRH